MRNPRDHIYCGSNEAILSRLAAINVHRQVVKLGRDYKPSETILMDQLVSSSSAAFTATTGFSIDSVVTWMATNLLEPFLGSGLAVLYNLRYWIVALIIISAVVYFAFRAFQFFRH